MIASMVAADVFQEVEEIVLEPSEVADVSPVTP